METELTKQIKTALFRATAKQGVFGCFEVTIGWFGHERVDYMTYDTNGNFRFYEIKISKQDFYSKNHNTFLGHLNYYVMPIELYEIVKADIPKEIGVIDANGNTVKKPRRCELKENKDVLKDSLIRSLARDVQKQYRSGIPTLIEHYKREAKRHESDSRRSYDRYWNLLRAVQEYEHAHGVKIER